MDIRSLEKIALSARVLAMDAVQEANSGHPGLPLGCAELGAPSLRPGPQARPGRSVVDPPRPLSSLVRRSRLDVLYAPSASGRYGIGLDDIGPSGKWAANARTIRSSLCRARDRDDDRTSGAGPRDGGGHGHSGEHARGSLQFREAQDNRPLYLRPRRRRLSRGGRLAEASSLAGHLQLGKLIVFYDSNKVTIDGSTDLAFTEDTGRRYEAYGWRVLRGDMYDFAGLERLVAEAKKDSEKPTLIILKSVIGKGSPGKQGTAGAHGAALGEDEVAKTKAAIGAPAGLKFWVDPAAYAFYERRRPELAKAHDAWRAEYAAWKAEEPALAAELEDYLAGKARRPLDLPVFGKGEKVATRNASGKCLAAFSKSWTNIVGGSADLTGPNVTALPEGGVYGPANRSGRYIHFGIREFGMAAIANGLALHGGFRPFVATFLVFADYLRPALRLAALMRQPVIFVLTHDSIFIGEDGPTHQPVEHLASLRAIPNVRVLRPADAEETAVAWSLAMERTDGPTVIALSRQNLPVLEKADPEWALSMALGAYVVKNTEAAPDTVIVATGSEVSMALAAAERLGSPAACAGTRVVSMPSRELFLSQPKPIRDAILPPGARVVVAEAGVSMGWERIARSEDIFSIERFGESGPGEKVAEHLGFTVDAFVKLISKGG